MQYRDLVTGIHLSVQHDLDMKFLYIELTQDYFQQDVATHHASKWFDGFFDGRIILKDSLKDRLHANLPTIDARLRGNIISEFRIIDFKMHLRTSLYSVTEDGSVFR